MPLLHLPNKCQPLYLYQRGPLVPAAVLWALLCCDASAHHHEQVSMAERVACMELVDSTDRADCLDQVAIRDFQIGSANGRQKVDRSQLSANGSYRRAIVATGRFNAESVFYIGRLAGEHVAVTSRHVVFSRNPRFDYSCSEIRFDYLLPAHAVRCKAIIATWPELDLALIALDIPSTSDAELLAEHALKFDFDSPIRFGQPLLTAGFGSFGSDRHQHLMVNRDEDCMVMSADGDIRLRAVQSSEKDDPGVWSIAVGCDSSPGDSGSAILDRRSGRVIGVLWGGSTRKPEWVRDSAKLRLRLSKGHDVAVWKVLNYATPAVKIREVVTRDLENERHGEHASAILRAWLTE
jgi:hypothetical protein